METIKKDPKRTLKSEPSFAQKAAQQYQAAERELREFMEDPDILEILQQYHALIKDRNVKLTEAIQAAKSELGRSNKNKLNFEGIGVQKKAGRTEYDVDFLREHLPAEQAALVITERTVYELNVEEMLQLVRQEEIDKDIVKQAYKEQPASLAVIPGTPKVWDLPPITQE